MATYAWFDSTKNYLLVDENGAPFLGSNCPCVGACWQRYEASCIDNDGSPVWGSGGTSKVEQAYWGAPSMTEWSCTGSNPTNLGVLNNWVLDAPGTAHIWTSVTNPQNSSRCDSSMCSVAREIDRPTFPCSCTSIWNSYDSVALPYYSYGVTKWRVSKYDDLGQVTGSEIVPIYDVMSYLGPNSGKGGVYSSTRTFFFLENFSSGSLKSAQSFCGDASSRSDWEAAKSAVDFGSYMFYSVTSATSGASTGSYVKIPTSNVWVHYRGSGNAWIENGKLWVLSSVQKDPETQSVINSVCCVSEVPNASITPVWSNYSRIHSMRFSQMFASDQWGSISVASISRTDNHMHPYIVREARGAQVPVQDIDIVTSELTDGTYDGYPLWNYRTFMTTDYDLDTINLANYIYAVSLLGSNQSRVLGSFWAPAVFCPEYWFLYITEAWKGCTPDDSPNGLPFLSPASPCPPAVQYCQMNEFTEYAAKDGRALPYPYFSSGLWYTTSGRTETDWLHEVDEALDQNGSAQTMPGMRRYNSLTDEHAYKVSRLSIINYPTWYSPEVKCAVPLDGAQWEIPHINMTDSAWMGSSSGCYGTTSDATSVWPWVNYSNSGFRSSCAEYSMYPVSPIWVIESASAPFYYISHMMFLTSPLESGSTLIYDLSELYENGRGCPIDRWSMAYYQSRIHQGECCVTSGSASEWVGWSDPASIDVTFSFDYYSDCPSGDFTWQGNIPDPASYCLSYTPWTHTFNSPTTTYNSSSGANSRDSTWYTKPEFWVWRYPKRYCEFSGCDIPWMSYVAQYAIYHNGTLADPCDFSKVVHSGDTITAEVSVYVSAYSSVYDCSSDRMDGYRAVGDLWIGDMWELVGYNWYSFTANAEWREVYLTELTFTAEGATTGQLTMSEDMELGSVTIPLSQMVVNTAWSLNNNYSRYVSWNCQEDTWESSEWFPDDGGHWFSWGGGGRKYIGWQIDSTHTTDQTWSGSMTLHGDEDAVYLSASRSVDGMPSLYTNIPYGVGWAFLFEDHFHGFLASDWLDSPFTKNNAGSWDASMFADSNNSDQASMYWHINSSGYNNSVATQSLGWPGGLEVPLYQTAGRVASFTNEHHWYMNPQYINPCIFTGIDVLKHYPTFVLSTTREDEDVELLDIGAVAYGSNSCNCFGSFDSTWPAVDQPSARTYATSTEWRLKRDESRNNIVTE